MQTMWSFNLGRFAIVAQIEPCFDLDLSWDDSGEIAAQIDSGQLDAFDTRVAVYLNGARIGCDTLSQSIYADPSEFFSDHRSADPMNRNCSIMRAANGGNVSIGHYFPDMVRQAIAEARDWMASARLAA